MNKTFKKLLSIVIVIMMLFGSVPMADMGLENLFTVNASAVDITTEPFVYEDFLCYMGKIEVSYGRFISGLFIDKYLGSDEDIVVPAFIHGIKVIAVDEYAFSPLDVEDKVYNPDCINIKTVTFSEGTQRILKNTFEGCKNLETVNLGVDIRIIGEEAFKDCVSLKELNNNTADGPCKLYLFHDRVFSGCVDFKELILPESSLCISFYEDALDGSYIEKITVYSQECSFGSYVLEQENLKEIVVHGSLVSFGEYTFGHPTSPLYRPDTITFINAVTEDTCYNLFNFLYHYKRDDNGNRVFYAVPPEVNPHFEVDDGNFRYFISEDKAIVTKYLGKDADVVIPDKLGGYYVNEIFSDAFSDNRYIESVKMPQKLQYIGISAFSGCENLKNVEFNDGLKNIEPGAFNFTAIENVVLPESVTELEYSVFGICDSLKTVTAKGVVKVGDYAFEECTYLESAEFSDDLYHVGDFAFYKAYSLKSIGVSGEKITHLGERAFSHTALKEFTFNENLTKITEGLFANSTLEKLVIPENVTVIENGAFNGCDKLSGKLVIHENMESVGYQAFYGTGYTELEFNAISSTQCGSLAFANSNIEKITIGEKVEKIPPNAFIKCEKVKEIYIPDSVTEIGNKAFNNCTSLETITLPKNLKVLPADVFTNTDSLKTIYYNAENCQIIDGHPADESNGFYSPFGTYKNLAKTFESTVEKIVIGEGVKIIPAYFAYGLTNLKGVIVPDSVTEIGRGAFQNSSIETINLPENLVTIEADSFRNTNINFVKFPDKLRLIGESAFNNCDALVELYIPDSVVDIDDFAFYDCSNLKKVRMSTNVKFIAEDVFGYCVLLEDFIWDSDVKLVGEYAFEEDANLVNFDFTGVEKIYPNSFTGSGVNLVMLGENKKEEATELEVVEVSSFENCANLETLSIGGNVTTIKSEAFANCGKLETAVISPTVTNIAVDAFDGCDSLTIYCVEDSYVHEYAVNNGIPVSTFVIDAIPNQVYTGKEIEPDVNVKVSDKKLTENTDFAVKYSDNINVGTAKVLVSGKGIYKVLASVANFTIITKDLENIVISPVDNQAYTGDAVAPQIVVTNGEQVLAEGVDYTVIYKNNTEVGTATAEITGIGNYSGKTIVTFEIEEQTLWQKIVSFFRMIWNAIVDFFKSIF